MEEAYLTLIVAATLAIVVLLVARLYRDAITFAFNAAKRQEMLQKWKERGRGGDRSQDRGFAKPHEKLNSKVDHS